MYHYQLYTKNLNTNSEILEYKKLLRQEWNNNIYYSVEHLQNFTQGSDQLKYFLFEKNDIPVIIMPFIYRKIESKFLNNTYYDVISPYGYSGPLFNHQTPKADITLFWDYTDKWYRNNKVVSEFIRFGLNKNAIAYSGSLTKSLSNVKGSLLENFEDQWKMFSSKVRNNYRKALNYNLKFKLFHKNEITTDSIKVFNNIYTNTMIRNKADRFYYFSFTYFKHLILSNLDDFSIAVSYYKSIPVSAELIIHNNKTIYAFLGGTNAEYFYCRPNDFLRVKIIEWAIEKGLDHYVLGGGLKEKDSLYKSKKSFFPKNEDVSFYTGRKIVNPTIYNQLCSFYNPKYFYTNNDFKKSFFPFYRCKSIKSTSKQTLLLQ
jgi:hypothetical protein